AFNSFLRWPSDATPMSLRSSFVSRPSSSPSMSWARKISAYWARPIPRSQPSMSKFSPHLGSCQRQVSKKVEALAPTMIPRGFLNQLGFAMWTPTTRQKHSRTVTRYQTDLTDTEWASSRRTCEGVCNVPLIFYIEGGRHGLRHGTDCVGCWRNLLRTGSGSGAPPALLVSPRGAQMLLSSPQ